MSLGVVIKGPEGVVLAADSRVTLEAVHTGPEAGPPLVVNFDNATKLLTFAGDPHKHVGAVTYGAALVGSRTAHSYLPEFEPALGNERLKVSEYAERLSAFFAARWAETMPETYQGAPMTFIVGGYDQDEPYGRVFLFSVPSEPGPAAQNPGMSEFGMTWGGQLEIATRLIHGYDPVLPELLRRALNWEEAQVRALLGSLRPHMEWRIPYQVLPLQDCVDLATFLIRTTIRAQGLSIGIRGVGGIIEVAIVTRTKGLEFVQRKTIRAETDG